MRRSSLWTWLTPPPPQPAWRDVHAQSLVLLTDRVRALDDEVARLRSAQEQSTAAAVVAELRAQRLEEALAQTRTELDSLRSEVAAVREEQMWAFAERRVPDDRGIVVDLKRPAAGTG